MSAGAFDRVSSKLLVNELAKLGIHQNIFNVLSSWLECRNAYVIIENAQSHHFVLKDMIFQGTVLGPPLWNIFFASCCHAVRGNENKSKRASTVLKGLGCIHFQVGSSTIYTNQRTTSS